MISIIVAVAKNRAIGKNNDLLWHIPEDMKWFKALTTGHTIIMGKKTFESLPLRPLPNRRSIVITDDPDDRFNGCKVAFSIEQAIALCNPVEENFIIGGASIYKQFLPHADRLYLTEVHKDFEGDVFFPELNMSDWTLVSRDDRPSGEKNDFSYSFLIFDRKK
jgi:dihydrofolate reductase